MVKETISFYSKNGSPVYICSLDAKKAFDSCDWDVLFSIPNKKGVPSDVTKLLRKLYMNGTASVLYNGILSYSFNLSQGVRQCSILSPHLYNIYTESLLDKVSSLPVGTTVGNVYTGIVTYADDIILMSTMLSGLQTMVNCCIKFGLENLLYLVIHT